MKPEGGRQRDNRVEDFFISGPFFIFYFFFYMCFFFIAQMQLSERASVLAGDICEVIVLFLLALSRVHTRWTCKYTATENACPFEIYMG